MNSIYNFYAGPGKLPNSVLERIQNELKNFRDTGMSVMEISHRAEPILDLMERTQNKFKKLLELDPEDQVLFLQGGGTLQFSMIPMNLSSKSDKIDYVDTGYWSQKAIASAQELNRDVSIAGTSYTGIPKKLNIRSDAKYLHLCSNNTVMGTQWFNFPKTEVPIVADMSSDLLSRSISAKNFGLIYAHAQKTIGAAGVTVVIIPKKTIDLLHPVSIKFLDYKTHINALSNYHTPPVFAIYVVECMLDWLQEEIGGIKNMEIINQKKSNKLYQFLDQSSLFDCPIEIEDRSIMNVVFDINDKTLYKTLINKANDMGIVGINGHRSRGGLRTSLYNAVSIKDVEVLVDFLSYFEKKN